MVPSGERASSHSVAGISADCTTVEALPLQLFSKLTPDFHSGDTTAAFRIRVFYLVLGLEFKSSEIAMEIGNSVTSE